MCTQMMKGMFLVFKCNWISSYWKIKDFWREFGRTDVCFPQMKNMHLFPRNLNNNSKAVTQTNSFLNLHSNGCFYTNGEKSHSGSLCMKQWSAFLSMKFKWSPGWNFVLSFLSCLSVQLYLKTIQKPSLLKCCLSASLLPFSHCLISLSIHFFHFCYR